MLTELKEVCPLRLKNMFINLASERLEIVQLVRIESIEMSRSNKSDDKNRERKELR